MKEIQLGSKLINNQGSVYIIAEMSANHCGDLNKAKEIILKSKEIGADAVKLQTYTADTITLNSEKKDFTIPSDNPWSDSTTLHSLYQKAYTPWEWHKELFDYARDLGIDIFSAPFDESAVDFLETLNCPIYKLASPEITHIPLIKRIAKTGKPVIMSTGVAALEDVELAVKTLRDNGCTDFVILKCTSNYPAEASTLNLNAMVDLKEKFNCHVGLSDHSLGICAPVACTALGASVIEKHITLEKGSASEDDFFSLDINEFKEMIDSVRFTEEALGKKEFHLSEKGKQSYWGRRSLYVSEDIKKGDLITEENIKCVRPYYGLHPKHYEEILGKKVTVDLEKGDRLSLDIIESN